MHENLPNGAEIMADFRRRPPRIYAVKDGEEFHFSGKYWINVKAQQPIVNAKIKGANVKRDSLYWIDEADHPSLGAN